jgi:mycothiol synthase
MNSLNEYGARKPTSSLLSGITWRALTPDDLTIIVELAHSCFLANGGLNFMFKPESLSEQFFPDAPRATIGAFASTGNLVACAAVHREDDADKLRAVIVGHVLPKLCNLGLGTYLMRWSQAEADMLLNGTIGQRVLKISTESLTESARRLYHTHNFEPVTEDLVKQRDLHLPLPNCPFPPGVSILNWDVALEDQFFHAYDAAFRERPGFPGWTADEWVDHWTKDNEPFRPNWSMLARAGNVPLAFLMASSNPPLVS